MAQYFEVLSQNDVSLDQTHQFFNGTLDNEPRQVRYILTDDSQQFQTQQLIIPADQVVVLDTSQQQIQRVVIDQGHTYQGANQQQFGTVVQSSGMNNQPQQIFYMETNSGQVGDDIQAVIEQTIQNPSAPQQSQPIVLNHQIGSNPANRQVIQGTPGQRPVLQIRTPVRQGHIQVNQQPRLLGGAMRPGIPQQVRPHQPGSIQTRPMTPQVQMRLRGTTPQHRPPMQQQLQQQSSRPGLPHNQVKNQQLMNRQMAALQQKQQQIHQPPQPAQAQQVIQHQPQVSSQHSASHIVANQMQRSEFHALQQQQQPIKHVIEDELDDHDPTMNSSPGQLVNYKKLLEQRQQIGKNSILARLPSNIKVTSTQPAQAQVQSTQNTISQTIDDVVNQVSRQPPPQQQQQPPPQQQQPAAVSSHNQLPNLNAGNQHMGSVVPAPLPVPKKPRAPPRPKNPAGSPRPAAPRRPQRMAGPQQAFNNNARMMAPQQPPPGPRFQHNQQQQRFNNPQQMMQQQQRVALHQQPQNVQQPPNLPPPPPPSAPQNGMSTTVGNQSHLNNSQSQVHNHQPPMSNNQNNQMSNNQSQMNYLITPPTPNRPRQQRPLPSYIPSSQIQQIIENTPIAEEFSDSIRMLVLLENGEQRLITFTLPKEACTIQEILEQVNVPFTPETNIQVTEANTNGINYIVTVGNVSNFAYANSEEEQHLEPEPESQQIAAMQLANQQSIPQNPRLPFNQKPGFGQLSSGSQQPVPEPKPPSPEPPKLIPGKLAVCSYCGYTSEDFNKCARCNRKLPDHVRSIDSPFKTSDILKSTTADAAKSPSIPASLKANATPSNAAGSASIKQEPAVKAPPLTKKKVKVTPVEHESVVISSDEEEDEMKPTKMVSEQLLNKLGASISICPVTKEPSLADIKKHVRKLSVEPTKCVKFSLKCRTVRIGSYRFVPSDEVILDSKCVIVKAPVIDSKDDYKTIRIDRGDIVKVLVCFNKALPVIFYYLNVGAAPIIRDMLNITKESGYYFDPIDEKEDSHRKITLLPDVDIDDHKAYFQQLYSGNPYNIMDELTAKEANDILLKACPKDSSHLNMGSFSEIKQILMYPKEGQGRLSINTEDYVCLAVDQFLNDKIIDFYLKYLWENLPSEQQEKVHIFSTFFYKRLTTKPAKAARKSHPFESDASLNAAEKRHYRVKNWTKKINLFEKDYIVVPINENAHWFLAIICFPGMRGPQTFDGKPYNPEPKQTTKPKKKAQAVQKEVPIPCDDPMLSDKDEAESEESDMESDDSEGSTATTAAVAPATPTPQPKNKNLQRPPIKQPCILIFDSLAGPGRSRVVATLRDYLTCEFKAKMDTERSFNREIIKGSSCHVPQQNNFTDCGLYLLQYVEQFFKDPIKDYYTPIKGINDWFEEIVVTRKREEICNLLKRLMVESGVDTNILPDIALPTINGKVIERQEAEPEHDTAEEEQDDMFTDIEDAEMTDSSLNTSQQSEENGIKDEDNHSSGSFQSSPIKPSESSIGENSDIIPSSPVKASALKPTLSEFPRQTTNKETLNYLKSKRIIKHKPASEGPEYKKTKLDK